MQIVFLILLIFSPFQSLFSEIKINSGQGVSGIPAVLHVIDTGEMFTSTERVDALKSWREAHPKWTIKFWTFFPKQVLPIKGMQEGILERTLFYDQLSDLEKLECLKYEILSREGGVWVDPDLFCCCPLDPLLEYDFFAYLGKNNSVPILGAKRDHFAANLSQVLDGKSFQANFDALSAHFVQENCSDLLLPEGFIYPENVFVPMPLAISPSFSGYCFWRYKYLPSVSIAQKELLRAEFNQVSEIKRNSKKLNSSKIVLIFVLVAAFANGLIFLFQFRQFSQFLRGLIRGQLKRGLFFPCFVALFFVLFVFVKLYPVDTRFVSGFPNFYEMCDSLKYKRLSRSDLDRLGNYEKLYTRYFELLSDSRRGAKAPGIPRVLHFIWIGEREFPRRSIHNIQSWKQFNPSWKIKFWTDHASRPIPVEGIELHLIDELSCFHMGKYLRRTSNVGEKSDLLRYEILYEEGGLYVDHDVECFQSFDSFQDQLDFYACLEPLHRSPLRETDCIVTNCLIGSRAGHPILKRTMEFTKKNWDLFEKMFPAQDKRSTLLRVVSRTFDSFHLSVNELIMNGDRHLLIPPAFAFPDHFPKELIRQIKSQNFLFANHKWDNAWLKDLPDSSKEEVSEASKNEQRALLLKIQEIDLKRLKNLKKALKWNLGLLGFQLMGLFLLKRKERVREAELCYTVRG